MREQDKPFICVKHGGWSMKIKPRNGEGWRAMGMWVLSLILLSGGFPMLVARYANNDAFIGWATAGFLVVVGIWAVTMVRWMLARSEVIDVNEMLKLKRDQERARKGKN